MFHLVVLENLLTMNYSKTLKPNLVGATYKIKECNSFYYVLILIGLLLKRENVDATNDVMMLLRREIPMAWDTTIDSLTPEINPFLYARETKYLTLKDLDSYLIPDG